MVWIDEFAAALGLEPLVPEERRLLLELARQVAHRTERVNAPLAAYLVGRSVAEGPDTVGGIREAARRAEASLPPAAQDPGGR